MSGCNDYIILLRHKMGLYQVRAENQDLFKLVRVKSTLVYPFHSSTIYHNYVTPPDYLIH